jgi:hypothetical protein
MGQGTANFGRNTGAPRRSTTLTQLLGFALAMACAATALRSGDDTVRPPAVVPMFTNMTAGSGIRWVHQKPEFDARLARVMPWIASLNAGAAAVDYDGDGRPDLYVVNSRNGAPNHLYRNRGDWTFTDVAASVGLANVNTADSISIDPVFGDLDNDGDQDLFIACIGHNRLFRNDGGKYVDVSKEAGFTGWSNASAAILIDYDGDGLLDILIGHYFDTRIDLWHVPSTKILPENFTRARNGGCLQLFHNEGNLKFKDVTEKAGLKCSGWTLDIGAGDINNDGKPDLYVANDYGEDIVYLNNGDGTFRNVTRAATGGDFAAGMNVDFGDFDNDGRMDIYVSNITNAVFRQGNMLWKNMGDGTFTNVAQETGTFNGGWGWGAKFVDFDNDGLLDIFAVNGFVTNGSVDLFSAARLAPFFARMAEIDISDASTWPDMRGRSISGNERHHLFHNEGGTFREIAAQAGVAAAADGRGVVLADFDGDGAMDVFVTNCGQAPLLYRNQIGRSRNWLQLALEGTRSNRDAIGARVRVVAGDLAMTREVDGGNGFSSQSTRVLQFGLNTRSQADLIEIRWPSGTKQTLRNVQGNRKVLIREPQ